MSVLSSGLFIFLLAIAPELRAATLTWGQNKFEISYPKNWQKMDNFFGVPVTLLGPMLGEVRPIVQIIPTTGKPLQMSETELKSFNDKFLKTKEAWLKKREGRLISVLSGQFETIGKNKAVVSGLSYRLPEASFVEKNFYINCAKGIYQLKILVPYGKTEAFKSTEEVVRSFECRD